MNKISANNIITNTFPAFEQNNQTKQGNNKLLNQFHTGKANDFSEEVLDSDVENEESEDEDKCLIDTLMKMYQTDPASLGDFERNLVEKELAKANKNPALIESQTSKSHNSSEFKAVSKQNSLKNKESSKIEKQEVIEVQNSVPIEIPTPSKTAQIKNPQSEQKVENIENKSERVKPVQSKSLLTSQKEDSYRKIENSAKKGIENKIKS